MPKEKKIASISEEKVEKDGGILRRIFLSTTGKYTCLKLLR